MALADSLNELAALIEAGNTRKRVRRTLEVAAFALISTRGVPEHAVDVMYGDDLYIRGTHQPGAGIISRDRTGQLFAVARGFLQAGLIAELSADVYEKRWILGDGGKAGNCDDCQQNADAGWIPEDEDFPAGASEPEQHPNCTCGMEMRRAGEEDRWQDD